MLVDLSGQQIGPFRILRPLGEGGMGAVFLAEHSHIGDARALKVLHPEFTQNASIVQRFLNEARASGKLKHRNIVGVHDTGQLPGGAFYIVFEYVPGQTLAKLIDTHVPLHPREIVRYLSQIANALRVAHALGIVHRDLKPENVQLTARDGDDLHVMVLDWGIAHLIDAPDSGPRTQTGMLLGTVAYMSPEQLRGQHVGAATDMFALGTIAYRMATGGWFPYQRDRENYYDLNLVEIGLRHRDNAIVDPRERNPHLHEGFVRALLTALAVDPTQRPAPDAYALMLADEAPPDGRRVVQRYARELLGAESPEIVSASGAPVLPITASLNAGQPRKPRYRRGKRLGAGGMAEVYLASMTSDEGIERTVAIKRVLPEFSKDVHFARMFGTEAQIASRLKHSNIVAIEDFARDEDGQLFIAMEYVEGCDLDALAKTGPLPIGVVIYIITEILYALKFAHNLPHGSGNPMRGVVHRDISPHNVLLSWEGAIKLSDFGLAKIRTSAFVEASVFLKGKPRYMSPEQAQNFVLDGRSDLFAVGVVLWQLLTDKTLFDGQDHEEVILNVRERGDIVPPSSVNANVKADLDRVALTLLQRDLEKRYANAEAALEALLGCADADARARHELERLLAQRFPREAEARAPRSLHGSNPVPTAPTLPPPRQARLESSHTTQGAASGHATSSAQRSRWHWVAAGLVAVVAATVAVIAAQDGSTERMQTETAAAPTAASPVDGQVRRATEPTPVAAKITIVTDPPGALIRIDGRGHGPAPVIVPAAVGVRLAIDAEYDGFEASKESVTVDGTDQTVTLRLRARAAPPVPVVPQADAEQRKQPSTPVRPARRKVQKREGSGAGSGSSYDENGLMTTPDA